MDLNTTLSKSYDTEMLILRTMFALDPDTNMPISTNYVVTTDGVGGLVWLNPFTNLSTAGTGIGYLPSTIDGLRSNISSISTIIPTLITGLSSLSTVLGQAYISTGVYNSQLTSSLQGLGTMGFVSSSQLASTVAGLGTVNYVSSSQLVSTVNWLLDPSRYISSGNLLSTTSGLAGFTQLISTVQGLGTAGYISTQSLTSSLNSTMTAFSTLYSTLNSTFLSSLISTFPTRLQLNSTILNLGTTGYISTSQLVSTITGLGTANYVSSTQLVSTMNWLLDPSRYVSSGNLISTANAISTNVRTTFFIDNAGNINIFGGTTIVSSVQSVVFLSTFVMSSITYQGQNGSIQPVRYPNATTGNHTFFSSARLRFDIFSSFITSRSRINVDLYPTFVFPRLNTGATDLLLVEMSSMIAYGNTYLSSFQASSWVYAGTQTVGFGNPFQQEIKFQIPGSIIQNNYANDYIVVHNLVSSVTSNLAPGFVNSNILIRFASTNSVVFSIQNLP